MAAANPEYSSSAYDRRCFLNELPQEVLCIILSHLSAEDLCKLSRANRFLYRISSTNSFWKNLYLETFPKDVDLSSLPSRSEPLPLNISNNENASASSMSSMSAWKQKFVKDSLPFWKPSRKNKDVKRALEYLNPKANNEGTRVLPVVLLSAGAVGKSRVLDRFIKKIFHHAYDPTIEDVFQKQVQLPGTDFSVLMQLMDTSGVEEYSAMREYYISKSEGFIIMYSITSRSSFEFAAKLVNLVKRVKHSNDPAIIIAGAKSDLNSAREVSLAEGKRMAQRNNCPFLEISALQNRNIDEMFYEISLEIGIRKARSKAIGLAMEPKKKKKLSKRSNSGQCTIM